MEVAVLAGLRWVSVRLIWKKPRSIILRFSRSAHISWTCVEGWASFRVPCTRCVPLTSRELDGRHPVDRQTASCGSPSVWNMALMESLLENSS